MPTWRYLTPCGTVAGEGTIVLRRRVLALATSAAALAAILGGCTESKHGANVSNGLQLGSADQRAASTGSYKVGKPYRINGSWYYPAEDYAYVETGIASWYGAEFNGRRTANGEAFDMNRVSAAHRTLPLPSMVKVTNLENGRSLALRVNDRGPFTRGRIIDVSCKAAELLGFQRAGTARVRVEILATESKQLKQAALQGASPDRQLASLRAPAANQGAVASNDQVTVQIPVATRLYVQVGAFARPENAARLQSELAGFGQSHVHAIEVDGRRFYRVRVGPIQTIDNADWVLGQVIQAGYPQAQLVVDGSS